MTLRSVDKANMRNLVRRVIQLGPAFEKMLPLNINAIALTAALFYSRYVQLGPEIYSALRGQSFPSISEFSTESPFRNLQRPAITSRKTSICFLPRNNDTCVVFILSSWKIDVLLNCLFILGGDSFILPRG